MMDHFPEDGATLTEYVVGFAMDRYWRVALIRKNRPAWQAGRLNGIGGHVEPGESPDDAMWREFQEETGYLVTGWDKFLIMDFPGARIHFYRRRSLPPLVLDSLRSMTDEEVVVFGLPVMGSDIIPNLSWLLPLAAYTADDYEVIHVEALAAEAVTPPCTRDGK